MFGLSVLLTVDVLFLNYFVVENPSNKNTEMEGWCFGFNGPYWGDLLMNWIEAFTKTGGEVFIF